MIAKNIYASFKLTQQARSIRVSLPSVNMGSMKNSSPTDIYTIRVDLDLDPESNENRRKSSIIRDISDKVRNVLHISDRYSNKKIGWEYTEMGFGIPGTFKVVQDSQDGPQIKDSTR